MPLVASRVESRKEVAEEVSSAAPKRQVSVAAWNARTIHESGKSAQVTTEMRRYSINIVKVSEALWTDSGKISLASAETVCYSGRTARATSGSG